MPKDRWCVAWKSDRESNDIHWCAVKGRKKPNADDFSVETRCKHFIVLPLGLEKRQPTCPECQARKRENSKS